MQEYTLTTIQQVLERVKEALDVQQPLDGESLQDVYCSALEEVEFTLTRLQQHIREDAQAELNTLLTKGAEQ